MVLVDSEASEALGAAEAAHSEVAAHRVDGKAFKLQVLTLLDSNSHMGKEYFLEIEHGIIVYVDFKTNRGKVKEFVVKLLCEVKEEWHEIIRFDSGHNCPHKDILNTQGKVIRKIWYEFLDNSQALTMAITDIKEHFEFYRERYVKWLKTQDKE